MSDVTQILSQIDPTAAEQLLPLVYDELHKLAAAKVANEKPGQSLPFFLMLPANADEQLLTCDRAVVQQVRHSSSVVQSSVFNPR